MLVASISLTITAWRGREQIGPTIGDVHDGHSEDTRGDRLAGEVIDRLADGVLVLNAALVPVFANEAARRMLGLGRDDLPARLGIDELSSIARRALAERDTVASDVMLWPGRLETRVRAIPLELNEDIVLVIHDASEEGATQRIHRQFVVNASHELKTPVAGIQALGDALLQALEDDPDAAARFAKQIVAETDRLGRLVTDLLDLSRLEDPAHVSRGIVDLSRVVTAELERIRETAAAKSITVTAEVQPAVQVHGDGAQLGLMVRNLIDNAVRYTDGGGHVDVTVIAADSAEISVQDNGVGIPLRDQARVFERFFRVDDDRSRATGGTGLGLAIVKHVAELHGGRVNLSSEFGEGSTFTVTLPTVDGQDATQP